MSVGAKQRLTGKAFKTDCWERWVLERCCGKTDFLNEAKRAEAF
jgi:hypothetical protein